MESTSSEVEALRAGLNEIPGCEEILSFRPSELKQMFGADMQWTSLESTGRVEVPHASLEPEELETGWWLMLVG